MDYEQRYNDALARAKKLKETCDSTAVIGWCEHIFPELKESESKGERIRKKLIELFHDTVSNDEIFSDYGLDKTEVLDWLEKQKEPKDYSSIDPHFGKSVDKAEPKFKVGKWYQCTKDFFGKGVTFDKNTAYYCAKKGCLQDEYGCHIAIVKDLYDNFKLWTIQDAKDGDVLATDWYQGDDSWEKIIIFKKYHNKGVEGLIHTPCVEGYGNTFKNGEMAFDEEVPYYSKTWTDNLHPATKEQRDLLFARMKEEGYEWNKDKKKLIKL